LDGGEFTVAIDNFKKVAVDEIAHLMQGSDARDSQAHARAVKRLPHCFSFYVHINSSYALQLEQVLSRLCGARDSRLLPEGEVVSALALRLRISAEDASRALVVKRQVAWA